MKQYTVTGMSCAACSARVEKAVSKVPGVTSCSVSLLTNFMGVEGNATDQEIIKAVVDAANKEALVKVIIETCYLTDEEKKKFTKIGISIHSVEEAKEAEQLGASYLTAGHIYATDCKRGLPPRGLGFLKEVCREVSIPVYGIGGIKFDEEQWNDMEKCGAIGGCIMSGMMEI